MSKELQVYERPKMAIDVRREMLDKVKLSPANKKIFEATTKTPIEELQESEVVDAFRVMFRRIAEDVGYKIPNDREWQYIQTRLYQLIVTYYGKLTISEIKVAFELSSIGELDKYLPTGENGVADRNHYQKFNAAYVGKVLKAYESRKADAMAAAYGQVEEPIKLPTITDEERGKIWVRNTITKVFCRLKYRGEYNERQIGMPVVFEYLQKIGKIREINITQEHRKKAYEQYKKMLFRGEKNRYEGMCVMRDRENSEKLTKDAYNIAVHEAIKSAMQEMIDNEEQLWR